MQDEIVAFYTEEGKRYFQIGRKIDENKPWEKGNVEWKKDGKGHIIRLDEYFEAYELCFGKKRR